MDSPPPLPPQFSRPVPKKGIPGWAIALLVAIPLLIILAIGAAIAVPAFTAIQKKKLEAERYREAAQRPAAKLTAAQKDEAMKFAQKLCAMIDKGEAEAAQNATSMDAWIERVFAGSGISSMEREGVTVGIRKTAGGLLGGMSGARTKPKRLIERDGFPAVTVRLFPASGGVNFVDLLLKPDGGTFKVVDVYVYLYGSLTSSDVRENLLLLQQQTPQKLATLLGLGKSDKKSMDLVLEMFQKFGKKDMKGVHRVFELLPPEVRQQRSAFMADLKALQFLQDDPLYSDVYRKALESAGKTMGGSSAVDLLLVDLYFIKGDFAGSQKCLDRVMLAVGEDAYLYHLKGMAAVKGGDVQSAAASLSSAERLEPDLRDLFDLRLQVLALKGDFAKLVEEIERLNATSNTTLTDVAFQDPVYDRFRASPEFAGWVKRYRSATLKMPR